MELDDLALFIGNSLKNLGTKDIDILQVDSIKYAKRMIICTAQDNFVSKQVAQDLKELLKEHIQCFHSDGIFKGDWIVLDFNDIVVHIFTKDTRQKYNIEKLYKNAKNCFRLC